MNYQNKDMKNYSAQMGDVGGILIIMIGCMLVLLATLGRVEEVHQKARMEEVAKATACSK